MQLLELIKAKKLLSVSGKGGIGKSLVAAALAQYAAGEGLRVCLVESTAQDQLAPLFGLPPVGHKMTSVADGISIINLNPQDNFRDFVVLHLGFARLFEKVFTKPIVRSFIQMLPGIAELTLLGRLYHLCVEKKDYDLVVFDAYASGHFMSLMKTPEAVLNSGMVGPVIDETKKVMEFLFHSEQAASIFVATPEELVVSETLDFVKRYLNELDSAPSHILVNRCLSVLQPELPPLTKDQSMSPVAPALEAIASRVESELKNRENLQSSVDKLFVSLADRKPEISFLADLGAVDEPLRGGFAAEWFTRNL